MNVDPAILRRLLRYEPETGKLFWLPREPGWFADGLHSAAHVCAYWNSRLAGREAFTIVNALGYRFGKIFNVCYAAHRVIWAMQTGAWPDGEIDHADCNAGNNTWANLRIASRSENIRNTRRRVDNTSGAKGVVWDKNRQKWRARISIDRREITIGRFTSFSAAESAVAEARARLHGEFARA